MRFYLEILVYVSKISITKIACSFCVQMEGTMELYA